MYARAIVAADHEVLQANPVGGGVCERRVVRLRHCNVLGCHHECRRVELDGAVVAHDDRRRLLLRGRPAPGLLAELLRCKDGHVHASLVRQWDACSVDRDTVRGDKV